MASAIYPKAKQAFLQGGINMSTGVIRAVLVDTGAYTYNTAHDFYNDLSGVVGTESGAFTTKTFVDGLFDADNITFTAVTGATVEALVIFLDTGNVATDALIAYIDQASAGLPATPNGGDISIAWAVAGIFQL
jgi:hypothetical protein